LIWWGIQSPPDNIMSEHCNKHPSKERIMNMAESSPNSEEHKQGRGNGPQVNNSPRPPGYYGGKESESQRFASGLRKNWPNEGVQRDRGNIRGRGLGARIEHGGSCRRVAR